MTWKRWRNCWNLYVDGKKVGVVSCVKHHQGYNSMFYAYLKGVGIEPYPEEHAGEGAFGGLYRAKFAVEDAYLVSLM